MDSWRCRSGSFRMNVALDQLPDFKGRPGTELQDHHTCSMFICPSLQYCEDAYLTAKAQGYSQNPIMDITIPSTLDDTLAPPGKHVATIFMQHVAPELPDGRSWDDEREKVADHILIVLDEYAPNFSSSVLGREIWSPADLERELGLVGGDIFHGSLGLDQIYSFRPAAGFADYRTPLTGLYMCGSGTHPGGGVTGAPGHNAAQEILRDLRRKRV
jgi:phytoene dehydrogenase-like protein